MEYYGYVYRISIKVSLLESLHYYGSRTCKMKDRYGKTPLEDLRVYQSSSSVEEFTDFVENYIDTTLVKLKIIKTFTTASEAINYENKLHIKFQVHTNPKFINKSIQSPVNSRFDNLDVYDLKEKKIYNIGKSSEWWSEDGIRFDMLFTNKIGVIYNRYCLLENKDKYNHLYQLYTLYLRNGTEITLNYIELIEYEHTVGLDTSTLTLFVTRNRENLRVNRGYYLNKAERDKDNEQYYIIDNNYPDIELQFSRFNTQYCARVCSINNLLRTINNLESRKLMTHSVNSKSTTNTTIFLDNLIDVVSSYIIDENKIYILHYSLGSIQGNIFELIQILLNRFNIKVSQNNIKQLINGYCESIVGFYIDKEQRDWYYRQYYSIIHNNEIYYINRAMFAEFERKMGMPSSRGTLSRMVTPGKSNIFNNITYINYNNIIY